MGQEPGRARLVERQSVSMSSALINLGIEGVLVAVNDRVRAGSGVRRLRRSAR